MTKEMNSDPRGAATQLNPDLGQEYEGAATQLNPAVDEAATGEATQLNPTVDDIPNTGAATELNPNTGAVTELNPNASAATERNTQAAGETPTPNGAITLLNPALQEAAQGLPAGTVLGGKYEVVRRLSVTTGEADLYLCAYEEKQFVAKVYRRRRAVKPEVITALKAIDSPYIAKLYDTGTVSDRPYEILPYYKNGSLQGKTFTPEQLETVIIPCVNEALRVLHENDIIHKDLKPANIMLWDDAQGVAIIDFGISSVVEEGNTVLVTQTGMTPEYSAPETFRGLFLEESDYYSFGVTLYELFCGYTPYKNMSADQIARFTAVQRIPFPKEMPRALRELISAVTYFDITNRHQKENPNRRWTYDEVQHWLRGKKQIIPGEGTGFGADRSIPPYRFLDKDYQELPALVTALATHWNEGKKQLYRGHLGAFFLELDPMVADHCLDAEAEATRNAGKDDVIFWDLLYKLYPRLGGFYWMGQIYESLPALGRDMLEKLWKNDLSNRGYWDGVLGNRLLSAYLKKMGTENQTLLDAAAALEDAHAIPGATKRDALMRYYTMAYLLSGQILYAIGDKRLKDVPELVAHMQGLLDSSYEEFEAFCHSLIDYHDVLDVQLEAWLIALGKREDLTLWRQNLAI